MHRKVLSETTGKKIRQELDFGYIPSDITKNGLTLVVDAVTEDIQILAPSSKDTSTQTSDPTLVDKGVQTDEVKHADIVHEMYVLIPAIVDFRYMHMSRIFTKMQSNKWGTWNMP